MSIHFDYDDNYYEYPNVNDMIKITNTLKPGSKAFWNCEYNEVALLIYLSSPHVQLKFPNLVDYN